MWIYPILSSDSYGTLLSQGSSVGIWYRGGTTKLVSYYYGGKDHQTSAPLTENQWHHIVITNNAGTATFYVDGKIDNSYTGAPGYNPDNIGNDAGSETFNGKIDQLLVWNRSLSASEIYELYASNLQKYSSTQWYLYVNQSQNATTGLDNGTYTYQMFASDLSGNQNQTEQRTITIGGGLDTIYPTFSDYWDNNGTLFDSGTALFNVTIENTNGTVILEINNTNISATNLTSDIYNASYIFAQAGTYLYKWHSFGNGTSHLYNVSETRNYVVNSCITNLLNTSWSDWINSGNCDIHDNQTQIRSLTQYDSNSCGEVANQTFYEYQNISCNYCSFDNVNTTKSDWYDVTSCSIYDNKTQTRNWTEYDKNYSACYAVTGLASDLFENVTWFENQTASCNYCSYSLANTSWGDWNNLACSANQMNQSRNLTQYDENYGTCYAVTGLASDYYANETLYEYQLVGPTYQNTSWSGWYETTECGANDTVIQERNLTQYDGYGCGTNSTFFESREVACDFCTPNMTNTTWIDWQNQGNCKIDDLWLQNKSKTEYDTNNCEEILNSTYWEYQNTSCDYCSYSIVNSSWSDWTNITCLADNTMNQTRNKTEYDENYSICYAVTNLLSDLWNSGNNNTYFEFRNILSCGEQPTTRASSNSGGEGSTKPECKFDNDCKTGYSCYSNKCAKLFDVKIMGITSPIKSRELFNLTYYIKGMAEIKGDVVIAFWIQNESNRLDLGKDTIYLGTMEEKIQTVKLFMPNILASGIYDFYTKVKYENYSAESYRKIEIIASSAGMQINNLNETTTLNGTSDKETPKKEHGFLNNISSIMNSVKGFFSKIKKSVSQNKNYLFIGFVIFVVLIGVGFLIKAIKKRKPKDMTKLKNLKGLRVYSENGNYIGRLKETYLEDGKTKIYGYLIKVNKKIRKKIRKKNILVKHKHIRAAKHIMIIDEKVAEHLDRFSTPRGT